ncbi:hypothetical protein GCM10017600_34020 [Streptosporangium carneum]|uniref:Uncharacterized protein n=1 Tax=Streptosporangium carneum TaxID=47481 RepID=A0A9W6I237_9ACTN|nr:hypothetical protein GCM10017600_34020 [Streptosporangium carneum]
MLAPSLSVTVVDSRRDRTVDGEGPGRASPFAVESEARTVRVGRRVDHRARWSFPGRFLWRVEEWGVPGDNRFTCGSDV